MHNDNIIYQYTYLCKNKQTKNVIETIIYFYINYILFRYYIKHYMPFNFSMKCIKCTGRYVIISPLRMHAVIKFH